MDGWMYGKYTHTPYQFRCCRKLVQMKERCYNPAPDFSSLFSQLKQGQCTSRPWFSSIFLHSKAKSLSESITQWSYHCISVLCKHCRMQLCGQMSVVLWLQMETRWDFLQYEILFLSFRLHIYMQEMQIAPQAVYLLLMNHCCMALVYLHPMLIS